MTSPIVAARAFACALLLVLVGVLAPTRAFAVDLMSAGPFLWDIQHTSSGELSNGSIDAYDGCYYLDVDGTRYRSTAFTASTDGRTVTLTEATIGTLRVQRIVYVPAAGGDWARYLDVITNPGATDVTARVRISGNLGSDSSTRLIATSSGDLALGTDDAWFATDDTDGSGDPSLVHLFQGGPTSGALVSATTATLSTDSIDISFDVNVPAGGRAAVLTWALQYPNQMTAQAEATRLLELPDDAIVGLEEYAADVVNFSLGSYTEPCVGVAELGACMTPRGEAGRCRGGSCCAGCWNGTRCVSGRAAAACGRGGGMCATCADTDACTSDVCSPTGSCTYPDAPLGTVCDDGLFCTASDRCDGAGSCGGAGSRCDDGISCTTDVCVEATRSCSSTPPADQCIIGRSCVARGASPPGFTCLVCDPTRDPRGWSTAGDVCAIGGVCVAPGTRHSGYPCLVCDPARDDTDWSPLAPGDACSDAVCAGGRLVTAGTCSMTGACTVGTPVRCEAGFCASATECASTCMEGDCPGDSFCAPSGVCELRRANASSCDGDEDCVSGHCVDRMCCSEGCTEECRSCRVPENVGTCVDVPPMTDPDGECGLGGFCDESGVCARSDAGPLAPDAAVLAPDAGPLPDAARVIDAAMVSSPDAAVAPPTTGGCACSVPTRTDDRRGALLAVGVLAALVLARRRRSAR